MADVTWAAEGWKFWRLGENGSIIDEVRSKYLTEHVNGSTDGTRTFRIAFWDGFYDHCTNKDGFADVFNDPADRAENSDAWASFGINRGDCNLDALLWSWDKLVGAELYCRSRETYKKVFDRRDEVEDRLSKLGGEIVWDELDADKKSRTLTVKRVADFGDSNLSELYEWMVECMFALRNIAVDML